MIRIRRALARLFRRPAVAASVLYVRRPSGGVLDVESYATGLVVELIDNHLDTILEIADERGSARPYDGYAPESLSIERLVAEVGYEIRLTDAQAARLAEQMAPGDRAVWLSGSRAVEGGAA
ncbi:hypothetical protein HUF15_00790 [Streptomyces samsunensis]|uniref:hypothetical protein n=1 Tax=Streptomyces malaysiensis TaxID=92644 RepID=UPI0015822D98|nr:hypothetical protein [Streptomyces samsunensis]NUH35318.1 hypothetical protein [Streptomyces samsunensis]